MFEIHSFDITFFGFGARHHRRQHRAGVVTPRAAPGTRPLLPWALACQKEERKDKEKGSGRGGFLCLGAAAARRTEPHLRYFCSRAYVDRAFLFVTAGFSRLGFFGVTASKKARPSEPLGGAPLLVNRNFIRPRYVGPNADSILRRGDPPTGL